jgi:hypothetical protein
VRQTGVEKERLQRLGDARHARGVLQHHGVARHERRQRRAQHLPEGKIPRHDGKQRAERHIRDMARAGVSLHLLVLQEVASPQRVVFAGERALFDFCAPLAHGFAHFLRHQASVGVAALAQKLRQAGKHRRARGEVAMTPAFPRFVRRVQGRGEAGVVPVGELSEDLPRGGVDADVWHLCYPEKGGIRHPVRGRTVLAPCEVPL